MPHNLTSLSLAAELHDMTPEEKSYLFEMLPGVLPDHMIKRCIKIDPLAEGIKRPDTISYGLTSCGYDIRLGTKFKLFNQNFTGHIDPKNLDPKAFISFDSSEKVLIPPGGYLLGESVEAIAIPRDVLVICIGKSTYARVGCTINVTPGEPEWYGKWTIEIENAAPVPMAVYPNEGIMQCIFLRTAGVCHVSYADKKGKYQGDDGLRLAAVDGQRKD